ncbi:potassium channel family protein [Aureivirga marina]|uniref:potassium channel family protein n=1 Tax=Aureivirga marina TaxID=1182451 RepID=UPI0018CA0825|nr:ion channel [Aureivirga marina]
MKYIFTKKNNWIYLTIIIYYILLQLLVYFENASDKSNIHDLKDAFWYSIVTLTTVGYGDFYPVTFAGRAVGILFVVGSLGVLSYIISKLTDNIRRYMDYKKQGYFGTKMEGHYIIIGWSSFTNKIVEQIINANKKVVVITNKREDVDLIKSSYPTKNCFVLYTELNDFKSYVKANIDKAKRVYLEFESDTDTLVFAINLKKNFPNVKGVIVLNNVELKESFKYLGFDFIVSKDDLVSKFVASYIFEPFVALYTEDLIATSTNEDQTDIVQLPVEKGNKWIGTDYYDAFVSMKKESNCILIGVTRDGTIFKNPKDFIIKENDLLLLIANVLEKQNLKTSMY